MDREQEESFISKGQSEASAEVEIGTLLGGGTGARESSGMVKEGGEGESEEGEEEEVPCPPVTEEQPLYY